ncbi:zinc finger CCCH domain-containing protein 3-like isoform X1 [Lytechinus variegatus]|uniref:zinc finger CCCH domain-containing protein 3-like isoform X1 n=1 Tax=Lytechinus variegatus TaxID=7654 RepID=UPI001BB1D655|nr:zinc finger CCCH domain-containing protein 3-like isoform X1 [Lytechinus variegatus]
MVNTGSRIRKGENSGNKRGSERQKLADELSFLAGLISKHKEKPADKESKQNASGHISNQFSWTKERPSSSSSPSSTSYTFQKQGHKSQTSHYFPSKDRLTWKKPKERSDDHLTSKASRYKYFSKDVYRTAIERSANDKTDVFTSKKKQSSESGQHPLPGKDDHSRRSVVSQQGRKLISTETANSGISKACPPSRVSTLVMPEGLGKADSTDHGPPARKATSQEYESRDRSSVSNRQQNKGIVVLPTSKNSNTSKSGAKIDEIYCLSGNVRKQTVSVNSSSELSEALASDSTATKPIMPEQSNRIDLHEKQQGERQSAKVLATLSKELDKCLVDIARLKETRTRTNEGKAKSTAGTRKPPCVNVRDTKTENTAALADSQAFRSNQECKLKLSSTEDRWRESKLEESAAGTECGALPRRSDYKWLAPKVNSAKASTSNIGNTNKEKAQGTDNLLKKKWMPDGILAGIGMKEGLKPLVQRKSISPRMKIIRTKYKMKKQLSPELSSSVISRHKVDHRKAVSTSAPKLAEQTDVPKSNVRISRYKLVKASSHPGMLSPTQPEMSSLSPRKPHVAINSRYKKVKGHPPALESPKKSAIVIPHHSQLKLNRMKAKSSQKNTTKRALTSTSNRKQSKHKIDRRPRGTAVVRSRFKMRKVSSRTPRKMPPKQSPSSSPFKWQAKKATPSKPATPDTFMRRRMHFVLTHTPVLLRTRFRLVNSQHNNSTAVTGHSPKQPLLKKTRTKLIRKSASAPSSPSQKHPRPRLVIAKGVHYHQSKSGKSLRRISGSSPAVLASSSHRSTATSRLRQGSLSRSWTASMHRWSQRQSAVRVSSTQWVANRVLRRTIQEKIQRGNKNLKREPYCKFYNRYGRCHRGDKCPYIHDPDKIAVCTQFLRGTCKKTDGSCPFSHKVSKDKMPVCVYFLKGICNRDNCPYSHVKVSKKAEVCQEFLHGYCPRGAKCKKKHTLDCAEFNETGQCTLGNKCPLWHRKRKMKNEGRKGVKRRASEGDKVTSKRSNTTQDKPISKPEADAVLVEYVSSTADDGDDVDTPEADSESGSMPSFIALDSDSYQSTPEYSTFKKTSPSGDGGRPALKIRPLFAPSMGASTSRQGQRRDSSSFSSSLQKTSVTMATGCSSEEEGAHP